MTKDNHELEANILRYYHVEKWRIGTISHQLHVHHETVRRVLAQSGIPCLTKAPRPSQIDAYLPFILDTLKKYPSLTASRLYAMVYERGYRGHPDYFRHLIARVRPRPRVEAYLRLRTLPGEQAQVDWGHFGAITIGRAKRPLMAFVMVLSYSRKIFLQFYLNAQMENFLRGHEGAFGLFGGIPRVLLYDNLKSAVLERAGEAIRFHPTLLAFAAHYRFEPRPVAVARGNEKGRVERAIRYIRDNFFAARTFKDVDDLNEQANRWCAGPASSRRCPEDNSLLVQEAFLQEQSTLIALPDNPYATQERLVVRVGKTPYVRFDLNDYSIPHTFTQQTLTIVAEPKEIQIFNGTECLAHHMRSYDKGQQIEDPSHLESLVKEKSNARQHRGQDRFMRAIPKGALFLKQAAAKGYAMRSIVKALLYLQDCYGTEELIIAVDEALAKEMPHPNVVSMSLEKRRKEQHVPPPIPIHLPDDKRVKDLVIRPHDLETYQQLQFIGEDKPSGEPL